MTHKNKTLTKKELSVQDIFMAKLDIKKRQTKKPIIVTIIGLVGSGKSSVSRELSKQINATIVESDSIRIELRKQNANYKHVRNISENAVAAIIRQGGNVILDSDFVDEKKRASIREKARDIGAKLVFIRTHTGPHIMLGRMIAASYKKSPDDFFGGAKTNWKNGTEQQTGAVIKIGEAWRRTPHHYNWINQGGGKWVLKKFPFAILAEIDTTDSNQWKQEVKKCAKKLLAQ